MNRKGRAYLVRFEDVEEGRTKPTRYALARSPREALARVAERMMPGGWLSGNFVVTTIEHGREPGNCATHAYMISFNRTIRTIERQSQ